jgi:hypothetical protein
MIAETGLLPVGITLDPHMHSAMLSVVISLDRNRLPWPDKPHPTGLACQARVCVVTGGSGGIGRDAATTQGS